MWFKVQQSFVVIWTILSHDLCNVMYFRFSFLALELLTDGLVQLQPVSIVSYNHLGNNDGKNLSAPKQFRSKEVNITLQLCLLSVHYLTVVPVSSLSYLARGFISIFSQRATGFYRLAKRFEPNFFIRKPQLQMVKPAQQNLPQSLNFPSTWPLTKPLSLEFTR